MQILTNLNFLSPGALFNQRSWLTTFFYRRGSCQVIIPWKPFISPVTGRLLFERLHVGPLEWRRYPPKMN